MANKQALRELQSRLAERMQQVRDEPRGLSWLALDSAGLGLLVPLQQAGEIFELGALLPVPHTRPWMAGVVNLRGSVHTVVDLAQFLGLREAAAAPPRERGAQLVAFNAALGVNVALLIDRLLGLRHAADMAPVDEAGAEASGRPAFASWRWRDAAGRQWQELNLAELARSPAFLGIAA
ncbi:chemotaxis protein CheW [Pseudaquabacterium rugosum]|jgi:twitching motility protein PilI|uniref:Chemotaxis protein CheW n=1 Tax=Pseudaquabacterium rugosum TaxID=2984194 RepID=A0ABU9B7N3_9BURK